MVKCKQGWWFPQLPINHICWSRSASKLNYCFRNEVRGRIFRVIHTQWVLLTWFRSCVASLHCYQPYILNPALLPWFTDHIPDPGNNLVFKDSRVPNIFQLIPSRHEKSNWDGWILNYVADNGKISRTPTGEKHTLLAWAHRNPTGIAIRFANFFQDYSDAATVHGVSYICQRDQSAPHRILWLLIFSMGVLGHVDDINIKNQNE